MTEARFEELVNLYLDNEIGRHDLADLKQTIRENALRRMKFERACQLHQAARKALVSHDEPSGGTDREPQSDRGSGSTEAVSSHRSSRSSGSGGNSSSSRSSHAYRGLSTGTLAQHQWGKGKAGTVDLNKVSLESSRSRNEESSSGGGGGGGGAFSFFTSPSGMLIASVFAMVGAAGLYALLGSHSTDEVDPATPSGNSAANSSFGPLDRKELLRELQKGHGGNPDDAMHATIYQSAAGQPADNSVQVNYTTSQMPAMTTSANSGNAGSTMTVQISQTTLTAPANGNAGVVNSSQLQITLPPLSGLPGNQAVGVRVSLPQITPPVGTGNTAPPAADLPSQGNSP